MCDDLMWERLLTGTCCRGKMRLQLHRHQKKEKVHPSVFCHTIQETAWRIVFLTLPANNVRMDILSPPPLRSHPPSPHPPPGVGIVTLGQVRVRDVLVRGRDHLECEAPGRIASRKARL